MVNSGFRDMNETQGPGHQDLGTKKCKKNCKLCEENTKGNTAHNTAQNIVLVPIRWD